MKLFEIRGLTKVYKDRTVLDIPELDFEKGIIYSLLGPNGSGKTTLLEILGLLSSPTTGRMRYEGIEISTSENNLFPLRREIVMVQQNPVLFTTTVYKNLEFGLKIRGIPKRERGRIIEESLDLVGMRNFMGMNAPKLSGGETQRVAIARALACSPRVILFDEPTANVDVENQITIERIMMEINSQKKISLIFATHNLIQASKLSRKVISLFEGRVAPSVYENIFSGRIIGEKEGLKLCQIQGDISLLVLTEKRGSVRLSIDPLRIKILRYQNTEPGKNVFKARLTQLTDELDQIRATVDIGIPLNILLPRYEAKDMPLHIGHEVVISCPADSIRIF